VFYPPASWMLGAAISSIVPWTLASDVFIWIVLVLAGCSMFRLAGRWLNRRDALFAAVLYTVNPYHLVIAYWRSAFAELLASCLVPMLLLLLLKAAEERGWRTLVPLACVLAAAWLTNAPAAVMVHYSLALLTVLLAWQYRSPRLVVLCAAAVALGACLAAFYLFPAIYEQKWIEIANAVSAGSRPGDNFLFIHTTDADHDAFNRVISWVAVLEMMAVLAAAWAARQWRETSRTAWNGVLVWGGACSLMMFPVTSLLWRILPKMQFMQFPWRWMLCLSMIFSLLITVALSRWWMRIAVLLLSIVVIVMAWQRVLAPWWDNAGDLREMQDNMATGAGYEGTDEYTPVGADPANVDKDARKVTVEGPSHAAIRVHRWDAESKAFTVEMSQPDRVVLKLFAYPAWKVEVNGRVVQTAERDGTGQMLVPVEAGINNVQLTFTRTWDRTAGGWVSIGAVFSALGWFGVRRRHRAVSKEQIVPRLP